MPDLGEFCMSAETLHVYSNDFLMLNAKEHTHICGHPVGCHVCLTDSFGSPPSTIVLDVHDVTLYDKCCSFVHDGHYAAIEHTGHKPALHQTYLLGQRCMFRRSALLTL